MALARVPPGEGWRAVGEPSLHVTLAFLGRSEAGEEVARVVRAAMTPVTRLSLGEVVLLPARRPRVMAVKLGGDMDALQSSVAGALAAAGLYAPEERPFLPHVTIGRARSGERPERARPAVPDLSFAAESVSVYESHLSPKGARYEALATFPVLTIASDPAELRAVRLAALADSPGSFAKSHEEEAALPSSWWTDLAARSAAGVTDRVFLAPDGTGIAAGRLEGSDAVLWGMWVDPSARGRGLARMLLRAVVGWARSAGARRVVLRVHEGVPHAARLYQSEGFTRTCRVEREIGFEMLL